MQPHVNAKQARMRDGYHALRFEFERMPLLSAPTHAANQFSFAHIQYAAEREYFTARRVDLQITQSNTHGRCLGNRHACIRIARKTEVALVIVNRRTFPRPCKKTALRGTCGFLEAAAYAK
jgi:hypothetical protein